MVDTRGTGPALGQAQLEVVGHRDEKYVVVVRGCVEDLLELGLLLGPKTAAEASFVLAAAGGDSVALRTPETNAGRTVHRAATARFHLKPGTNVSPVVGNVCFPLYGVPAGGDDLPGFVAGSVVVVSFVLLLQVPIERLVQLSKSKHRALLGTNQRLVVPGQVSPQKKDGKKKKESNNHFAAEESSTYSKHRHHAL